MRLSKVVIVLAVIFLIAGLSQAQVYIGVQGGLGFSSFEDQDKGATGIPLGATIGTDLLPILDVGAEAMFMVSPYKFDATDGSETEIKQNFYGAYVRWYVLPLPAITPYIKGGVAYYSGKWDFRSDDYGTGTDLKGSVGFNIGAGVDFLMGLYGEVVYHIVSHEIDMEGLPAELSGSKGYNSIQVTIGYTIL